MDDRHQELQPGSSNTDPFLLKYQPSELRTASEFLTMWLPFLSQDLCHHCSQTLSNRICSIDPAKMSKKNDEFDEEEEEEVREQDEFGEEEDNEHIRFMKVKRRNDFICFERINGKRVNILEGLELHTDIFSAAEQSRIVNLVTSLQMLGRKRKLKDHTYSAPPKWMRGKGRQTIQFGCCYNYINDRDGNLAGILKDASVDAMPSLFKKMIRRLVKWHVLPSTCVPDSCIVNIYDEGDCIPPHIDSNDFVRPFCTISFISECNILFGSNIKIKGPGEFEGSFAIPLPVGSVLVFNGNGANIAKHCIPAVPKKRISITFRRMDKSKRPFGYVREPDLQGIQLLAFEVEQEKKASGYKPNRPMKRQRDERGAMGSTTRNNGLLEPCESTQSSSRFADRWSMC